MNVKTLLLEEQDILNNLYLKLEKIEECFALIQPDNFDWNTASDELRLMLSIEYNSLSKLKVDHTQEIFTYRKTIVEEYLNERINETQNHLLKAKYNHFLYCLTTHNKFGNQAIEEYQKNLELYLGNPNQEDVSLNFQEALDIIIHLTKSTNHKKEEFKKQIHNYLKDHQICNRIKTYIISSILKSDLFKGTIIELDYISKLCIDLAKNEIKHRFVEMNLQLGLDIAKKLQQNSEIQKAINELLGDNEYKNIRQYDGKPESIIIPHQNRKTYKNIIQYYKNATNIVKHDKAVLEYNENKKNCKLLKFSAKIGNSDEKKRIYEELFFSIINSSTKNILYQLILGNNLMFIPDEYLEKYAEENKNNFMYQYFKLNRIDINNNEKDVEIKEHLKFEAYSLYLSNTLYFYYDVIMTSFECKKLSYNKVAKELSINLFFGQELIITRNDQNLSYTWFSMLDIGLKSFFEQLKLVLRNKQPDWRFSIDFLSLKFEGVLRDIVDLTGGIITKTDKNGNTTELILEDLLRSDSLKEVFNKDDLNLFQHTLTNKGYNIRNNVAHSFYIPQDYTWCKAVLVFLCVLRLAKYNYMINKVSP
ncbi:DUF4209 domain-containing protein [Mucilaginibacter sp.]|uniref:DUF4209 domain-containing protein n=1 Tax=Mucilaginibacter sp. TaxID=1882438 RepID=UPI003B005E67